MIFSNARTHYRRCCIIKINEEEYGKLLNKGVSNDIIVTLGSRGARWRQQEFPTYQVEVFDVSGAGDTVIATASLMLASQAEAISMAAVANLAGGWVCERVGVVPITREALEGELPRLGLPTPS